MKFMITNDDGYDAPGILTLREAVGDDSVIVAPLEHQSGCSHRVSFWGEEIEVIGKGNDVHAVTGTTADCTRVGLTHLVEDVDWVLSGVNLGGNLGHDIYMSGTVAGVREAAFQGKPGIAFSHFVRNRNPLDWERAGRWTRRVLDELLGKPIEPGEFWNVNFPHLEDGTDEPSLKYCEPCKQSLPIAYRVSGNRFTYSGVYAERARDAGKDVEVCFSGDIAISKLRI
jgi:5'-nucleotidase